MRFVIEAACGCNTGKIRKNNEDNFCFAGYCLDAENNGLSTVDYVEVPMKGEKSFAVFDGMGGENYGELASYAAAYRMSQEKPGFWDWLFMVEARLEKLAMRLNEAVLEAKRAQCTDRMGTTMVSLTFSGRYVYLCNVGDSRAYLLRDGQILQISEDHVAQLPGRAHKKAPLTQHLGIDPEDLLIEPYIAGMEWKKGDVYLMCSDGLTDMLSDEEISRLIQAADSTRECADGLIRAALEKGGRDNITVILCKVNRR